MPDATRLWVLGTSLARAGRLTEALECFRRIVEADPRDAAAQNSVGLVLEDLRRYDEAATAYQAALQLRSEFPEAWFNLGNVSMAVGRCDAAVHCYERALFLRPGFAGAALNLGSALLTQERTAEAIVAYRRVIAINPGFAEAHEYLGNALKAARLLEEAVAAYEQALALRPDFAAAWFRLGDTLLEQDRGPEAGRCFDKAILLEPDHGDARWGRVASQLPAVFGIDADPTASLAAFRRELDDFERWLDGRPNVWRFQSFRIQSQFYLAYREENNRDLLRRHGSLCARIAAELLGERALVPAHKPGRRIRIGVVSHHFRSHSVWHAIVKGWFLQLDREQFELFAFHLDSRADAETQFARDHATHFEQGRRELRAWAATLTGHDLDVLIYPEIGMEFLAAQLASLRLAPVQMATWGHPETTGLPEIDYFLSAEDLEPTGAHANYTERLVLLPNLGCYCEPHDVPVAPLEVARLGIEPGARILLCPGVPYKYAPEHDRVFPELARRVERCRLVFFHFPNSPRMSEKLRERLQMEFARQETDFDRSVAFVRWQAPADFLRLMRRADVLLDTIGFSGFNTAIQAIECGLPVVTQEGWFLRGRLASGILKRMGLGELVARSDDEYVEQAVALATDAPVRDRIVRRIESSRHLLFRDGEPIRALERFLVSSCRPTGRQ